jgi:hypothetical protein
MPKKKILSTYNAFTKSYKLRYVVHASRNAAEKTVCGRAVYKSSKDKFDEDAVGSCMKCIKGLEIERRIHPGWEA